MKMLIAILLLALLMGCASTPPQVFEREYREIPEGYLQPCTLPETPLSTGELSEAFVAAYKCAQIGNNDKQRIRELTTT